MGGEVRLVSHSDRTEQHLGASDYGYGLKREHDLNVIWKCRIPSDNLCTLARLLLVYKE